MAFIPTRTAGLARLAAFQPRMGRAYADRRNHDLGPPADLLAQVDPATPIRPNVSALSPWLRHRLVSEGEALQAALPHGENAAKFISEVLWRSYFKGWLEQRPAIWTRYCVNRDSALAMIDGGGPVARDYAAAIAGTTGIDCFDAWAGELVTHGWLHNHARMWFASIWIFTLRLPWQLGANFFLTHLLDGDAASNTLSWRWVAGLHTPGKNYLARAENIRRYTGGRFDPRGLNETADCLPMDGPDDGALSSPVRREWPRTPIAPGGTVSAGDYALLLHADDGDFAGLALPHPPVKILGLTGVDGRARNVAAPVRAFADAAVVDAVTRASAHFGCLGELVTSWPGDTSPPIAAPWLPVGWLRDSCPDDAVMTQLRGPYDSALWPLATAGFFKLKMGAARALAPLGYDLPPL